MVYKNIDISIVVKENRLEAMGCRSLVFDRPRGFVYEAGDWIDIKFGDKELKGGTTYSLSSSPTDDELMITFKDGASEIKRALTAMKPDERLRITQYGNDYKFTLNPHRVTTLIAGGVGIAPYRSMIREMITTESKNNVHLIYLNQSNDFLFLDELNLAEEKLSGLSITYIETKQLKRKDKEKAILAVVKSCNQSFYIAGPEGMVESTEHLLLDLGVRLEDIKIDSFGGY